MIEAPFETIRKVDLVVRCLGKKFQKDSPQMVVLDGDESHGKICKTRMGDSC